MVYYYSTKKVIVMRLNIEKNIAIFVVAAALVFVAYDEFSNTLTGAALAANTGYMNCYDSDPANDVTVRGSITVARINRQTNTYEPLEVKDECLGPSRVEEWSCTSYNRPIRVSKNTYCPRGTECITGVCM